MNVNELDRYYSGELTDDQRQELEQRFAEDPRMAQEAVALRVFWMPPPRPVLDVEGSLQRVRMMRGNTAPPAPAHTGRTRGRSVTWTLAGVSLAVALALGGLGRAYYGQHAASSAIASSSWKTYMTLRGQQAEVRLADGSRIILAPETTIRVQQQGEHADRHVALSGDAFFEVVHDPTRPFSVQTDAAVITELGTAFGINARPQDSVTQVVVTSGRVTVNPRAPEQRAKHQTSGTARIPRVLSAGDLGTVTLAGLTQVTHNVETDRYVGWTEGRHRMVMVPLRDIAATLERWYDLRIEYEDPAFADLLLTAVLRPGSLDGILGVISTSLNLDVQRRGKVVRFVHRHR